MILAIDPSASRTGWCKGHPGGPVKTGSLGLGSFGKELGPTLNALDKWLERALDGVDFVFYEGPIQFGKQSFESRRKLYSLGALIELRCHQQRIRVREINNAEAKKVCYGSGKFSKTQKEEHGVRLATEWGFSPANHDQADACAVFLRGVQIWFEHDFQQWVERKAAIAQEAGGMLL
jgi:Holliday junction resolvasome RuvABC endonuclease subunit